MLYYVYIMYDGLRFLVSDFWSQIFCLRCLVSDFWSQNDGLRIVVSECWSQNFGLLLKQGTGTPIFRL